MHMALPCAILNMVSAIATYCIQYNLQTALELAREGRPDELAGTKSCRHALSLALLEVDSELTDVHTWLEARQR